MPRMNFANAPNQRDMSELIPQGTLSWGVLKITPHDLDQGAWETPSKPPKTSKYLKCDIILEGGRWDKRHVFTNINTKNDNLTAVEIGGGQIKAILECGRGANEVNPATYDMDSYSELDGLKVAIKVNEEHSEGYNSKNNVAVFLSPFQNVKDWERLLANDCEPKGVQAIRKPKAAAAAPETAARWAQPQGGDATAGQTAAPAPTQQVANPTAPVAPAGSGVTAAPPWLSRGPGPQQG